MPGDEKAPEDIRQVQCPACKLLTAWSNENPHRPFCSVRCKDSDFIDWANESHRIAGSAEYGDLLSETQPIDNNSSSSLH